jgi:Ca-activated chloride channel family protein
MSRGRRIALAVFLTIVAIGAVLSPFGIWFGRHSYGKDEFGPEVIWQHPWFLVLLVLVPIAWWRGTFGQDRRTPRLRIGTVAPFMHGPRGVRTTFRDLPGVIRAAALAAMILALARPVNVSRDSRGDEKGIDIVLVMDLSGSMRAVLDGDAKDLPGAPHVGDKQRLTRLDTAKLVVRDFVRRRKSDRIGIVVFATSAFVLSPPTLDYQLLDTLVDRLQLSVIDPNQTAIGDAVGTAVARLRRSDARSKVVILLTDGDNNAGMISPEYATHLATQVGAKLYTIQIGNDDEVEVEDGTDLFGHPHYVRHRFPVNPTLLKWMAQSTGGEAFIATDGKKLAESMHEVLNRLEKTRFEASTSSFEDLFPLLVVPAVFLVGLDALLRAWWLRRFP